VDKSRDTYKYQLKIGRKVVHIGHTSDLKRREAQHQQEFPGSKIYKIGRQITRDVALRWERQQLNKRKFEPKELKNLSAKIRSQLSERKDRILSVLDKRR